MSSSNETKLIETWKSKIMLITLVLTPLCALAGSYYSRQAAVDNRISALELRTEQNFASKSTVEAMQQDLGTIRLDLARIKTLLETSRR